MSLYDSTATSFVPSPAGTVLSNLKAPAYSSPGWRRPGLCALLIHTRARALPSSARARAPPGSAAPAHALVRTSWCPFVDFCLRTAASSLLLSGRARSDPTPKPRTRCVAAPAPPSLSSRFLTLSLALTPPPSTVPAARHPVVPPTRRGWGADPRILPLLRAFELR